MYEIEKKFTFEAAHVLEGLKEGHSCGSIHGHSYKLYVKITSEKLDEHGFIIDFGKLKEFGKEYIDKYFDHALIIISDLNNSTSKHISKIYSMPKEYSNTTVENMCHHITKLLLTFFESINFNNFYKIRVKMFETENNSGSYTYTKN